MDVQMPMSLLAWVMVGLALPATLYLAILTVAGALPARRPDGPGLDGPVAIVVPAHDEAAGIERTVANLAAEADRDGDAEVVVIADNCTDETAARARAAGARVIERHDPTLRGKGFALAHAFATLSPERHVAYLVVDADSEVETGILTAIRRGFGTGAQALQGRYAVLNGDDSPRTRLAEMALAAFNLLRPRARERLGASVGILGNGFALRREVLTAIPYTAGSVVEDLEYHLRLATAGIRVRFVDEAAVRGEMPAAARGAATQRARWEGGRLLMLRRHALPLLGRVLRGQWRLAEPLAELLLLPLAYQVLLVLTGAVLATVADSTGALLAALAALGVVAAHVVVATRVAGLPWRRLLILARVPLYLLWKLRHLGAVVRAARPDSAWIRTDRNSTANGTET